MLQNAHGDQRLGRTQCYDWYKRFKDGRESVDDDPSSGRPLTSTDDAHVTKVNEIVRFFMTTWELFITNFYLQDKLLTGGTI